MANDKKVIPIRTGISRRSLFAIYFIISSPFSIRHCIFYLQCHILRILLNSITVQYFHWKNELLNSYKISINPQISLTKDKKSTQPQGRVMCHS